MCKKTKPRLMGRSFWLFHLFDYFNHSKLTITPGHRYLVSGQMDRSFLT
jgi:hypothetical protein